MPAPATSLKLDPAIKERAQRLASARRRTPHWSEPALLDVARLHTFLAPKTVRPRSVR